MTLRQLEIFQAIVRFGGFNAAARELHVAQPSVSAQVHLLEEELGQKLFSRAKTRKVCLTEAGNLLRHHAEIMLRQCSVAEMELSSLLRDPSGVVRMGIGQNQLATVLPRILVRFRERYPKICVDLVHGPSPYLVELLGSNQLDLGVISLSEGGAEEDLRTQPLFTEEMVVVVNRSDVLSRRRSIRPSELANLRLILFDDTMRIGRQLEDFFRGQKIVPNVVLRLNNANTLGMMIEEGLGATIVPSSDLFWGQKPEVFHALRISGVPLTRTVAAAMPSMTRLPHVAETLFDLLLKESQAIPLYHGEHHVRSSISQNRIVRRGRSPKKRIAGPTPCLINGEELERPV